MLTLQQERVLDFLKKHLKEKRYPPSVREICTAVGLKSTSSVHSHLMKLEEKGYIKRDQTKPRAIEILGEAFDYDLGNKSDDNMEAPGLTHNAEASVSQESAQIYPFTPKIDYIPIVGNVTAGMPILATRDVDCEFFPVPASMVSDGDYFMLHVKGDSMIEAGIFDRDQVLVRQQSFAKNGDIVVAMLDESVTVKTFYKEKDHFRLQPENAAMLPILVKEVEVLGVVRGVYRKLF